MTESKTTEKYDEANVAESVDTKLAWVSIKLLLCNFAAYSFRSKNELSPETLNSLLQDIKRDGLLTPFLVVKTKDGRYLVLNGHRRYKVLLLLIQQGVSGFEPDMKVPVHVIVSDLSETALVYRAIGANVQQKTLSAEGRRMANLRLHNLGVAVKEIADRVGVSQSTVERDIALANSECMSGHVNEGNVTATHAAILAQAAEKVNRHDDLCEVFEDWLDQTRETIKTESQRRSKESQGRLTEAERLPRRWLDDKQVIAWKDDLLHRNSLSILTFQCRAGLAERDGKKWIDVEPVPKAIDDLSTRELAELYSSFVNLTAELKRFVKAKADADRGVKSSVEPSEGQKALRELGLDDFLETAEDAGGVDEDFDVEVNENVGMKVVGGEVEEVDFIDAEDDPS